MNRLRPRSPLSFITFLTLLICYHCGRGEEEQISVAAESPLAEIHTRFDALRFIVILAFCEINLSFFAILLRFIDLEGDV